MPVIPRTDRQVTVNATPLPYSTGDGYAAPGRALQGLGRAIASLQSAVNEQEDFDFKMKLSEYLYNEDNKLAEQTRNYQGDGNDFMSSWEAGQAERAKQFTEQFSGRTRQKAELAVRQQRLSDGARARTAQEQFITQSNIGKIDAFASRIGSQIDGSTESITKGLQAIDEAINQAPGLTPSMRHGLRAHAADKMWKAWLQKASPEQMEGALKDFEAGVDKWRQQFDAETKGSGEDVRGPLTSGRARGKPAGWAASDPLWRRLSPYEKAAAMALLEADGARVDDAKNALGAMINRAVKDGEDLGAHVSRSIYQPTIEPAQQQRLARIIQSEKFRELAAWAERRAAGKEPDPVKGATHFLAHERTMLALEAREPNKYRSWRQWTGFDGRSYNGVIVRDGSHAFLAPEGARAEQRIADSPKDGEFRTLTGTPSDETGGPGVLATSRERMDLPERATMGDHAINEFMSIRPTLIKRIEEERARRAALEWAQGVMSGTTPFNPHDADGRKFIDKTFADSGIGQRVFAGEPDALIAAGQLSERMKYIPKPVYDAIRGLIEDKDPKKQAMAWTFLGNLYAANPSILSKHGDGKALGQEIEYVQRLARLHGMEKALEILKAERDPDAKIHSKAVESDVKKFIKKYEGDDASSQIAKDMNDMWWFRPDVAFDHHQKARAIADYRELLKRHYEATGSEEKAKAYAISDLKQTYGITNVFARRVMPYPPERFYPPVNGSHAYIADEIKEIVKTFAPKAKVDTIRIIADGQTARDVATGRPSYVIVYEREDGIIDRIPKRFVPGHPEAQAKAKAEFDTERQKALTERERARLNPPPPLGEMGIP